MCTNRAFLTRYLVFAVVASVLVPAAPALGAAPMNDHLAQATEVSALPFSETVPIDEATVEGGEGVPCVPPFPYPAQTVWYSITPTADGMLRVANGATFYYQFIAAYRQDGSGIDGLTSVACASWIYGQSTTTFSVEAGETYYIQAGSNFAGSSGTVTVSIELIPPPSNDAFEDAEQVDSFPFEEWLDGTAASFETNEPQPDCASGFSLATVWYAFTPTHTGTFNAASVFGGVWSYLAIYTGPDLSNLTEIGCGVLGELLTFQGTAGTTYYFQIGKQASTSGSLNFTLYADNQLPIGFHDVFSGDVAGPDCYAAGWTVDPDDLSARLAVRISADGTIMGETTADLFRQDLVDAGVSPDGLAGFQFDLRGHISVGDPHTILVEARDPQTSAWHPLEETPKVLTCAGSPPEGTHDGVSGDQPPWTCVADGWAVDPDNRAARLTVRVLVDGIEVVSTVAELFRQDLVDAGVSPDGLAGFNINLWSLISHGTPHEIRIEAMDNETGEWFALDSTPRTLSCAVPSPPSGIGFTGHWTGTDLDGSALTMHIGPGDRPPVTFHDTHSTQCDNNAYPSWVATGRGAYLEIWLFVTFHKPGCDPVEFQFYWDEGSDTLWEDEDGDGIGVTWYRRTGP